MARAELSSNTSVSPESPSAQHPNAAAAGGLPEGAKKPPPLAGPWVDVAAMLRATVASAVCKHLTKPETKESESYGPSI